MSIFSKIRGANKAAKEHKKAKTPDPALPSATPVPYRHVPTHAAIDAMLGAPSSWKEVDRSTIKAQNQRKSLMPKTDSSTSASLHRSHSHGFHNSYKPGTNYGSDYGMELGQLGPRRSYTSYNPYQSSRLASHVVSPAISEDESTSSSSAELLEISNAASKYPQTHVLHDRSKASKRQLGEAPLLSPPPAVNKKELAVPVVPVVPAASKRRSWGFKRSSLYRAITTH